VHGFPVTLNEGEEREGGRDRKKEKILGEKEVGGEEDLMLSYLGLTAN
jgi:hypothetical protein